MRALCPHALLLAGIVASGPLFAGSTHFASGPEKVALIELFTSEGCSSCPPAEAWLGRLEHEEGLWRAFVPVAFHVNYWDRLGWRDRFASSAFTDRQRDYARSWESRSVYTPCFVLNGTEWRDRRLPTSRPATGTLDLTRIAEDHWRVRFLPAHETERAAHDRLAVALVLLGSGLTSAVQSGENAGKRLAHGFVALAMREVPLARQSDGAFTATIEFPASATPAEAKRLALAGWVHPAGETTVLQAVGGWLDDES